PTHYIEMSDGVLIAVTIAFPEGFDADSPATTLPAVLEMSGYESGSEDGRTPIGDLEDVTGFTSPVGLTGGTRAAHEDFYPRSRYASVTANVRGTGCSSGEFDLFSERSAIDGVAVIEWIAAQPWSNGKIGIFGHSYSGITGAMVAALASEVNDPKLDAVSVSGLIGDVYRDIVHPGGVTNYGFPLLWTGAVRPLYDVGGGSIAGILADRWDRQCLRNQAKRSREVLNDPILQGASDTDTTWFQSRSLVSYVDRIKAPIHITTAYQDEQTGPRGGTNVFDHLSPATVKRLVLLNGDHGSQTGPDEVRRERKAWLDHWLLDEADRRVALDDDLGVDVVATPTSVRVLLEVVNPGRVPNGDIESTSFPLAQTVWADLYFHPGGVIASSAPGADGGSSTYLHGSKRQAYSHIVGSNRGAFLSAFDGPDELVFSVDVGDLVDEPGEPLVIAGPITATLFLSATAVDTELMVQL
ncbi:MAG: CocE/NonD family hydrolase, partial [Candidatus Binatia bacterium]